MKKYQKILNKILDKNKYLNGIVDFLDGDVMALNRISDYNLDKIIPVNSLEELAEKIVKNNNVGTYLYNETFFINDWHFGCFVYNLKGKMVEHLSFDNVEKFKNFVKNYRKERKCQKNIKS